MWPHAVQRLRWNHQPSSLRHSTQPSPLGSALGSINRLATTKTIHAPHPGPSRAPPLGRRPHPRSGSGCGAGRALCRALTRPTFRGKGRIATAAVREQTGLSTESDSTGGTLSLSIIWSTTATSGWSRLTTPSLVASWGCRGRRSRGNVSRRFPRRLCPPVFGRPTPLPSRAPPGTMARMVQGEAQMAQMRRGAIEYCVLALLEEGERYGFQLVRELSEADSLVTSEGTVYPLLTRLRKDGFVETTWRESNQGPPRRYYRITREGRRELAEFVEQWRRFRSAVDRLLETGGPK
jgi:PadR family transcriptional regulator, regulatory protein PadR